MFLKFSVLSCWSCSSDKFVLSEKLVLSEIFESAVSLLQSDFDSLIVPLIVLFIVPFIWVFGGLVCPRTLFSCPPPTRENWTSCPPCSREDLTSCQIFAVCHPFLCIKYNYVVFVLLVFVLLVFVLLVFVLLSSIQNLRFMIYLINDNNWQMKSSINFFL